MNLKWLAIRLSQNGSNGPCGVSSCACGVSGVVGIPDILILMCQLLASTLQLIRALSAIGCILCHRGCGIAQMVVHTATIGCPSGVMNFTRNLSEITIRRHFASLGEIWIHLQQTTQEHSTAAHPLPSSNRCKVSRRSVQFAELLILLLFSATKQKAYVLIAEVIKP